MFDDPPDIQARSDGELVTPMTTVSSSGQPPVHIHITPTKLCAS